LVRLSFLRRESARLKDFEFQQGLDVGFLQELLMGWETPFCALILSLVLRLESALGNFFCVWMKA
jgi:hypothetical protein